MGSPSAFFALGAWQTYGDVDSMALEAATMDELYRDVSHFPEPTRSMLQVTSPLIHHSEPGTDG